MNVARAIDLYIGDLARRGRSAATQKTYRILLNNFADKVDKRDGLDVSELRLEDYEGFLDRWVGVNENTGEPTSPSTLASGVSLVRGFSRFLFERGYVATDVTYTLKRPKRQRPDDLDVVTISDSDVARLISSCEDWQEFLCVTTAAYVGARRKALANVRWGDVDLSAGTIRFVEKGGKVAIKPMPDEYVSILRAADAEGIWSGPNDYVIPNRRPASVRSSSRSDKVIWDTVKRVAGRAGVRAHVHALRAAFAVKFDEAHPDQVIALKELMGHSRLETTLIYLRRKDKARAMETVRDLSWGASVFESYAEEAHTGFEPVPPP